MTVKFFEHPAFKGMHDKWTTYRDLFEGDHATLISQKYLWPHDLELSTEGINKDPANPGFSGEAIGQKIRRIRAMRSRYFNMFEPVISNLIAMAFRKPIHIDPEVVKLFGDDISNVDGKGTSLESFIKGAVAIAYFRDGHPIIYVDAPGEVGVTVAEQKQIGFRPFMEVLDVLAVPDWQMADTGPRQGLYDFLRYEYEAVAPRKSALEEPKVIKYCKILELNENDGVSVRIYKKDEDKWELETDDYMPQWEEIPVATVINNESWVKDVAELQLVLFNLMSAYYNQLNTQAFQRIFVSGLDNKGAVSISEYAISGIPIEARPFIIEPSSTDALVSAINSTADQIYKVAFNRTRSLPAGSNEAPGAETIAEMNAELIALLKQALEEIEGVVNRAIRFYAMYKLGAEKGAAFTGKVTLPKDLDIKGVDQRLELFLAYKDEIRKVLSWRKAELRKTATEMGYDEEERAEILKEIESLKKEEPLLGSIGLFGQGSKVGEEDGQEEEADTEDTEASGPIEESKAADNETGKPSK